MNHKTSLQTIFNLVLLATLFTSTYAYLQVFKYQPILAQSADDDKKVMICHATDSHSNPYIVNNPNKSGDVHGHDIHNGPIWYQGICDHCWGDIIPPFEYGDGQSYPGKNWDSAGQAILENGCMMLTNTPVPTAISTIIPTVVPTTIPTAVPTIETTPIITPNDTPTLTPTIIQTPTPEPNPTNTPVPVSESSNSSNDSSGSSSDNSSSSPAATSTPIPTTKPVVRTYSSVLGIVDNYNPLVDGIRLSYNGSILGATTLARTGTVTESDIKLPSNNSLLSDTFLSIPRLKLDTQVYQGNAIGHELVIGDQEVLMTTYNQSTLLYGHNQMSVFGRLHQLQPGDQLTFTHAGLVTNYQIESVTKIADTDLSSLQPLPSNQIYLLTCSYLFPNKRWLVVASQI